MAREVARVGQAVWAAALVGEVVVAVERVGAEVVAETVVGATVARVVEDVTVAAAESESIPGSQGSDSSRILSTTAGNAVHTMSGKQGRDWLVAMVVAAMGAAMREAIRAAPTADPAPPWGRGRALFLLSARPRKYRGRAPCTPAPPPHPHAHSTGVEL